jgi:hypothetical protein
VEKLSAAISRSISIKTFVDRGLIDEALYSGIISALEEGIYKAAAAEKAAGS